MLTRHLIYRSNIKIRTADSSAGSTNLPDIHSEQSPINSRWKCVITCGGNGDPVSLVRELRGGPVHHGVLLGGGGLGQVQGEKNENTFDCTCAPPFHGSFNVFIFKSLFCLRSGVYTRHSAAPARSNRSYHKQNRVFGRQHLQSRAMGITIKFTGTAFSFHGRSELSRFRDGY